MFDGLMYVVVIVQVHFFMVEGYIAPAYTMYVTTLLEPSGRIIEFAEQFQRGMTGIQRFAEIMDSEIHIFDEEGAMPLKQVKAASDSGPCQF